MQRERPDTKHNTYTTEAAEAPVAASKAKPEVVAAATAASSSDLLSPFITVLVTPKITFSLPRKPQWRKPDDIPQAELQEAFLSLFPLRIDASSLAFKCATPSLDLQTIDRLVFRIASAAAGGDDERVLLSILSSLDKAYAAKYEKQLEEARADLLSSSMSFQVVADEVRGAQAQCNKRWEREVKSLKEQMSTNQKRLFLLEREKEGLQKAHQTAEESTEKMRREVRAVAEENATLKQRTADLEAQLAAMQEAVASHLAASGGGGGGGGVSSVPRAEAATQTARAGSGGGGSSSGSADGVEPAQLLAMQQQLSAMGEWLRTGATLLQNAQVPSNASGGSGGAGGASGGSSPHLAPAQAERLSAGSEGKGGHVEDEWGVGRVLRDGAIVGQPEASSMDEPSSVC